MNLESSKSFLFCFFLRRPAWWTKCCSNGIEVRHLSQLIQGPYFFNNVHFQAFRVFIVQEKAAKSLTWTLEIANHFKKPQKTSIRFSLKLGIVYNLFLNQYDEGGHNRQRHSWGKSDGAVVFVDGAVCGTPSCPSTLCQELNYRHCRLFWNFVIVENLKFPRRNESVKLNNVETRSKRRVFIWFDLVRSSSGGLDLVQVRKFRFENSVETAVWNKKNGFDHGYQRSLVSLVFAWFWNHN